MTRSDYRKMAELLAVLKADICLDEWKILVTAMSILFSENNPQLDRELFLETCKWED